jgi:hypothetical protein
VQTAEILKIIQELFSTEVLGSSAALNCCAFKINTSLLFA